MRLHLFTLLFVGCTTSTTDELEVSFDASDGKSDAYFNLNCPIEARQTVVVNRSGPPPIVYTDGFTEQGYNWMWGQSDRNALSGGERVGLEHGRAKDAVPTRHV